MKDFTFTFPGPPIPFCSPRITRFGRYNPRKKEMDRLRILLRSQYKGPLIECGVICDIFLHFPVPASESKKNRLLMLKGQMHHTKKPDGSNCRKLIEDVLQGIVIKNDSQIVEGRTVKTYSEKPRTDIILITLEDTCAFSLQP